jgi:hypothetical protein
MNEEPPPGSSERPAGPKPFWRRTPFLMAAPPLILVMVITIASCVATSSTSHPAGSSSLTEASSPSQGASPSASGGASPSASAGGSPSASAGGSPSPSARQVDLVTAVRQGLVVVQATGDGIQSVQLSLSSKTSDDIDVTVTPGMIFEAASADVQSMVATSATDVVLNPGDSGVSLTVDVACTNMHLSAPTSSNTFSVNSSQSRELRLLVSLADFQQASSRVQQFAVWTITDNPGRYDFTELCTDSANCSGPTDDEINQIRQLFQEAGITTSDYAALQ